MSRKDELDKISETVRQAVWNNEENNSRGYIIDLKNPNNVITVTATVEEKVHELFEPESHYGFNSESVNFDKAVEKYEKMENPYVFNKLEYSNLEKLPGETRIVFYNNLIDIEKRLADIEHQESKTSDLRFRLFKMENEKKKLYLEKENVEKEYIEISERKEENKKNIDEYLNKVRKNNSLLPITIINKILNKNQVKELNETYKSKAVALEKENIENTAVAFDKLLYKNELGKKIQDIERNVESLRKEYKLEDNRDEKRTEILKEKNMLFKVFYIDVENVNTREKEIDEREESE